MDKCRKFCFLLVGSCCFSILLPLSGLEISSDSDEEENFTIEFRVLALDGPVTDLFYFNGEDKVQFIAPRSVPSGQMEYKGPSPLVLYQETITQTKSEIARASRPIAQFETNFSGEWLFLLVSRSVDELDFTYGIHAVPDPTDQAEEGVRVINLSYLEVAFQINEQTNRVPARSIKNIKPDVRSDNSLTLRVAVREASNWKLLFSTVMEAPEGMRITLIVEESKGQIHVRRFSERVIYAP